MPTWNDLLREFQGVADEQRAAWAVDKLTDSLRTTGELRGDRNVLLYASAFLQKPQVPAETTSITHEDVNGFMGAIHGMSWERGLTLIIHTPGGVVNATETIVSYLRQKFPRLEVIIPTYAMSAGTMISLAADSIIMGRQSQLGPIDPQMPLGGRTVSAMAVVEQFAQARTEILANIQAAHVWAPVLQSLGPALLQEAQDALEYSESMVAKWVAKYPLVGQADAEARGRKIAHHFNDATMHKSHGRRIDRDEAAKQGLTIEHLETNQELQESVLTAYHLMTIMFEQSMTTKMIMSDTGNSWVKNWGSQ